MARHINPSRPQMQANSSQEFNWSPYIGRNETLIWQGEREAGIAWHKSAMSKLLFATIWLAFSIFWTASASTADGLFGLFGLPFIAIGFGMIYSALKSIGLFQKATYYALSNQRAYIHQKNNLQTLPITKHTQIDIRHNKDTDSIYFVDHEYLNDYQQTDRFNMNINFSQMRNQERFGFERIKNGEEVYQDILAIQSQSSKSKDRQFENKSQSQSQEEDWA